MAQDKLILRDGKTIACKIVAISEKTISYKDTAINSTLVTISKNDVLLTENQAGTIYMFGKEDVPFNVVKSPSTFNAVPEINETREQRKERRMKEWKKEEALLPNNILGFYIPELLFGRLTISFERLLANKSIGIMIPVSLTYNSIGILNALSTASNTNSSSSYSNNSGSSGSTNTSNNNNSTNQPKGTGFITGIDVNYYHDLKPGLKYYFGPRLRYGTDILLGGIEGLTFQLQNGIFKSSGKKTTSTLGFGIGFFKLSQKYANKGSVADVKQVYPWASFTWRLGFRL